MSTEVRDRIAEIRQLVETARAMPMSASVVVQRAEMLALLSGLEAAYDHTTATLETVNADRDRYVSGGQSEADRIIREAELRRDQLVSASEVFQVAKQRADQMLADAHAESEALRRESDDYIDQRLGNFEVTLHKTLDAVVRGRERLHGRTELSAIGDQHDADAAAAEAAEATADHTGVFRALGTPAPAPTPAPPPAPPPPAAPTRRGSHRA